MKKQFIYLAALVMFGCEQQSGSSSNGAVADPRPKEELTLINKMWTADSTARKQINDINKQAVIDSGTKVVRDYLSNTINAKFDNWVAYVEALDAVSANSAVIQVKIYKNLEKQDENELPQFDITLSSSLDTVKTPAAMKMAKTLKVGDRVVISGQFVKVNNEVNNDPLSTGLNPENAISAPIYDAVITDIKKQQ